MHTKIRAKKIRTGWPGKGFPLRILWVCQDERIRKMLSDSIRAGFRAPVDLQTGEDASAGVEYLRAHPVDVVILDLPRSLEENLLLLKIYQKDFPQIPLIGVYPDEKKTDRMELIRAGLQDTCSYAEISIKDMEEMIAGAVGRNDVRIKLSTSDYYFRVMSDCAPVLIWVEDENAKATFFNKSWLAFTGRSLDEVLGDSWVQDIHPDDVERCMKSYKEALDARREFTMEYRLRRYDGEYRWMVNRATPRYKPNGVFAGYIGSCSDITEQKAAFERELIEKDRTRQYLDIADIMIIAYDKDCRITLINPKGRRLLGEKEEELIGKDWIEHFIPAPSKREMRAFYRRLLSGDIAGAEYNENYIVNHRGEHRLIAWHNSLLYDPDGRVEGMLSSGEDITDRVKAQTQIKLNEERYRAAIKAAPVVVFSQDADLRYTWVDNSRLGIPPGFVIGRTDREIMEDKKTARKMDVFKREVIRSGKDGRKEFKVSYQGKTIIYDTHVSPLKDKDGKVVGIIGAALDISSRVKAQEEKRVMQKELVDFVEKAPVAMKWISPEGEILWANQEELKMLGYKKNEFVRRPGREFFADPAEFERFFRQVCSKKKIEDFETKFRCRDGSLKEVLIDATAVIESGRCVQIRCFSWDMTDQIRAAETRELLSTVLESSDNAVFSETLEGIITSWNKGAENIYGYSPGEMIGRSVMILAPPEENDIPGLLEKVRSGQKVEKHYTRRKTKDGRIIDILLSVCPLMDRRGDLVGLCAIAQDISPIKEAQRKLERYKEELETAVAERTDELKKTNLQLIREIEKQRHTEQRLKKSQEVLRNLSAYLQTIREEERVRLAREIHDELGQLLTVLKMDLFWLKNRFPAADAEMNSKAEDMTRIVDQTIQSVQRICMELRPSVLDNLGFPAAVQWHLKEFERRANISCRLKIEPEEFELDKDHSTMLFRIVQEALTNVMRHAKAGRVEVDVHKSDSRLVVEIRDDGIGIPDDKIDAPQSFGLVGMKERLLKYSGELKISGKPNQGTTVSVTLPLKKERKND